jgi:hypothetical protein
MLRAAVLALCPSAFALALDSAQLMDILVAAYPDFLAGHEGYDLVCKDGPRMPFDDGKSGKSFETLLDAPSLRDMFYAPYPLGHAGLSPMFNVDPGRARYQPFFLKINGDCRKGETARTMVDVTWLPRKWGKSVSVTRAAG